MKTDRFGPEILAALGSRRPNRGEVGLKDSPRPARIRWSQALRRTLLGSVVSTVATEKGS